VANAFRRWEDDELGGGLWYRDTRAEKSLYQAALALAALRVFELTRDADFLHKAQRSYSWMERRLLRPDALYSCEYGRGGPIGRERPDDIHMAGSVTFLGGNMAMGVLHARLYRLTGEDEYRQRAVRTAEAIRTKLVSASGIYLNDRDAWANGFFAGAWAREVMPLPGIDARHWGILRATADSICRHARTTDGYYSACWAEPVKGTSCPWTAAGSTPEQIMVSANSVSFIVAAAFLEDPWGFRSHLSVVPGRDQGIVVSVQGEPGLPGSIEASTDLKSWYWVADFVGTGALEAFPTGLAGEAPARIFRATLYPGPR
jgi:predicted alpha-1,6-mannanase (GH76 family)